MSRNKPLHLILCWHMHQPDYRHYADGEFVLPWTYLHALKDYTDMAHHLEQYPGARAVVNFVPILLDQIECYVEGFRVGRVPDPLLQLLQAEDFDRLDARERERILTACFRLNHTNMLEPFPVFKRLLDLYNLASNHGEGHADYLSGQYLADLLVWYHLAWTGEAVRRTHPLIVQLMSKGEHFDRADRRALYRLIGEQISGLIPRYKALADAGRIELSTTPHYHPIGPLLLDLQTAREAMPGAPLPSVASYPGGRGRLEFHVASAIESHTRRFGHPPAGVWPAEGGVSDGFLSLLDQWGIRWVATGQMVLAHSLTKAKPETPLPPASQYLYRPYRLRNAKKGLRCFFRDDGLSDLIGFEYRRWHGRDAVADFVHRLEMIAREAPDDETPVVSVILDGENAWEYYPYNGYYFLSHLYEALQDHPGIRMTTFSQYLDEMAGATTAPPAPSTEGELPGVVAGSWVYGTFSTWIGSHEKNRAWELLCTAKQHFDLSLASGKLTEKQIAAVERQLADCESSDWFWWFGDYNPAESVQSFDALYRENLANLYRLLGLPVPESLGQPISHGGGEAEAGGTMRRAG